MMKKNIGLKKFITWVLMIAVILVGLQPSVYALESNLDLDDLKVSDDYVDTYPNGVIEFSTTSIETSEGAGEIEVQVLRKGGTKGEAKVQIKAIEVSAAYGRDFEMVEIGTFFNTVVDKGFESSTILESTIKDIEEEPLTVEDEEEESGLESLVKEEEALLEDSETEEEIVEEEPLTEEDEEEESGLESLVKEEEALPEDSETEEEIIEEEPLTEEDEEEEIGLESPVREDIKERPGVGYTSPLHEMKDRILGVTTNMNDPVEGGFRFFGAMGSKEIEVQDALSTILPGASMELVFSEGESVKIIRLKIVEDDICEDDEVFNLGLYEAEGALLGGVCALGVIIKDNDKPAEEKIYLEQSRVFVEDEESVARFKLVREKNIETFMRFNVRTLAGTAVSGEHYTTLITEGVLLPGQVYKYIDVPVHHTGIIEDRDFTLIVETDRGENLEGKAWIMPSKTKKVEAEPMMMLSSYTGPEEIVVLGKNYSEKSLDDARVSQRGSAVEIELHGGYTRSGYVEYLSQNLVGIDRINMDVKVSDINSVASNTEARIRINGQSVKYFHDDWSGTISFTQFKRISPGKFQFKISSKVWNDGKFRINSISLRKQDIYTSVEPAETFKVDVYRNAHEVSGKLQDEEGKELDIMPGYAYLVNADGERQSLYYRDEIIRLHHELTREGERYGAYLWGYELYNHENQSWVAYPGDEFVLTSNIIKNHVYNSDSYNNPLRLRPVFRRRSAGTELNILEYGDYRGDFSIGGTLLGGDSVYTGRDENNAVNWKVGDVLEVVMEPAEGFYSKGLVDKLNQPLTGEGRGSLYLPLTAATGYLRPVFERNDAGVTITKDQNNDKIYVFVDKADKITPWEHEALYGGTIGLKGQDRSDKILENYDIVRDDERFSSRQISDLTLGEVVTLYAKIKEDGYIPKWVFMDGSDTILGSDSHVYTTHYGESFSFVMTSKDVEVKVGAVKKEATEYILRGKTVKINNTLKGRTDYEKISLDNPDSYQVLPNVSLSVMTFDQDKYSYVDEVGHRYSISTKSDSNGDFELYVPGVLKDHFFSVKTMQGEQVDAVNLTAANENIYIDLPFRNPDYTVTAIQIKHLDYSDAEINGSITIPKDPTTAARKVEVRTQTSSNNYRISKVVLNSYSQEGYLREGIELSHLGGSDDIGLGIWTGDLNLAEVAVKGGRFAVEVFDDSGRSRGETETGYVILQEPPDLMINIPAIGKDFGSSGPSDVPIIGSNVPYVPDSYAETTIGDDMELVILSGETLKQAISDNLERFDNESPWDKVLFLTEYMNETYSINLDNKSTNDTGQNQMHVGDIDKFPINFDLGIYLKVSTATGEADNGYYTLDYAFVTVALGTGKTHHINTLLFGFPVYMSFWATVWGGGILGIMGQSEDFLPGSFISYRLIYLLGIYGSEPLEYTGIVDTDPVNQLLLGVIYDQGGFAIEKMPDPKDQFLSLDEEEGDFSADFKEAKAEEYKEYMAKRLNKLISGNWDFYKDNQAIFEEKKVGFTHDLRERIIRYKNEYMEPTDDVTSKITEDWIKRFNMLLLLESLPQYLQHAPNVTFSAVDDSGKIRFDLNLLENVKGTSVASMISLKPRFGLGAGIGARGYLSIGGSGHINFVLNYQPWDDGRGTIEWSLNLDADLAIVPLSIALVGDTYTMFETENYRFSGLDEEDTTKSSVGTLSLGSRDLAVLDRAMEKSITAFVDRRVPRVTGEGSLNLVQEQRFRTLMGEQTPPLIQVPGNDRQYTAESTKHPQPKLHILDDGRLIIFYINDNPARGDYDRNSLYYSIYENGAWTRPVEVDQDGKLDVEFTTLKTSDGSIHLVWASTVETFGDSLPDANEMMNSVKLKAAVLHVEENGEIIIDEIEELMKTDNGYIPGSFGLPKLAFDEKTGKILLTYKLTDYDTLGTSLDYDDIDGTVGSFLYGPFSTLAYHLYDDGDWKRSYDPLKEEDVQYLNETIDLGGMRFIDAGITGLENPDIREYASGVLDQTAYLVYPLDLDGDLGTDKDRELFTMEFDFETEKFQKIIKLTDNIVDEANPRVVVSDHISAIFYGMNGEIVKRSLEDLDDEYLNYVDEGGYYVPTAHLEETIWDDDIILGYENQDEAQSFSFTVGEDDNLYLTWNEISKEYSDVLEREIEGRYIYVKAYDPKYETVESTDGSYYTGKWGSSGPIAYGDQVYLNEESLLVTEDGNAVIAVRDFDEKDVFSTTGTGTLLRVNHLTLMSSVGIKEEETRFYPQMPMTGHQVKLNYALENYGTFPAEKIHLKSFLVTDKVLEEDMISWSSTDVYIGYDILKESLPPASYYREIKTEEIGKHFSSGGLIHNDIDFEMPTFDKNVDIYIVAWEDGSESYPNLIHIDVPVEPALISENVSLRLSGDKSQVEITGDVSNYGNTPARSVTLELVNRGNYDDGDIIMGGELEFSEHTDEMIESFNIGDIKPGDTIHLGYTIHRGTGDGEVDFTKLFDNQGVIRLKLRTEYFDEDGKTVILELGDYEYTRDNQDSVMISDISISGEETEIALWSGWEKAIDFQMVPFDASKNFKLVYRIADPNIAVIDSSRGVIKGLMEGETKIIVQAYQLNSLARLSSGGSYYDIYGNMVTMGDEKFNVSSVEGNPEPVLVKSIPVKVKSDIVDSGNSDMIPSEPRQTEPKEDRAVVVVNGQVENLVTTEGLDEFGEKILVYKVEEESFKAGIEDLNIGKESDENSLEILLPFETRLGSTTVFDGELFKKINENETALTIVSNEYRYTIPAGAVDINDVAEKLGISSDKMEDMALEVRIHPLPEERIREIEESAQEKGYELLFPPVNFDLVVVRRSSTDESRQVVISKFNKYAQRVIKIKEGVDPKKITTGIVYNEDGTFSHVPTSIFVKDGIYYVKINSLTNSSYFAIWNPKTVKSVENHWSKKAVNDMASRLVIKNPESFVPNQEITRGEFAEYITKALGIYRTGVEFTHKFSDVDKSHELIDAIQIAAEYGIIKGYPDGSFKPGLKISREGAMAMYSRAMDIVGLEEVNNNRIEGFNDKDMVADWAYNDVKKTINAGVFNGKTNAIIGPKDPFTFAEAATAIRNLLVVCGLIDD